MAVRRAGPWLNPPEGPAEAAPAGAAGARAPAGLGGSEPPGAPPPAHPSLIVQGPIGAREILGRGFDLNVVASREIRSTAVLIGLLTLAALGPLAAILLAVISHVGGLDAVALGRVFTGGLRISAGAGGLIDLAVLLGVLCMIALAIDSQLLAVTLLASRATQRPFVLRTALELIRLRFWRLLRANVIIFLILFVPRTLLERWIAPHGVTSQSQFVVLTVLGIVLSVPFAYVASWIMLGPVGARESVRRSWRLARSRLSLAIVIAVINVVFQTIALFAAGAGLEVLGRVADALNLERATGLALFIPLGLILALAITAVGSLIFTIAALTAAPQVVAFLRLTGVTNGLDVLHDPDNPFATPRVEPLVARGMKIALVAEAIVAALAILQLR